MLMLKPGVRLKGVQPPIAIAINVVHSLWVREFGDPIPCVVTSLTDGKHKDNSLHYIGLAVDFRTKNIARGNACLEDFAAEIRNALGGDFDVILEGVGTPNEHLHVEYDPK